jgi:hypothetical protein
LATRAPRAMADGKSDALEDQALEAQGLDLKARVCARPIRSISFVTKAR